MIAQKLELNMSDKEKFYARLAPFMDDAEVKNILNSFNVLNMNLCDVKANDINVRIAYVFEDKQVLFAVESDLNSESVTDYLSFIVSLLNKLSQTVEGFPQFNSDNEYSCDSKRGIFQFHMIIHQAKN